MSVVELPGPRVERTPRRIRAMLNGHTVAESRRAMLHRVFGPPIRAGERRPLLPGYFFPTADVDMSLLHPAEDDDDRQWWHLQLGDRHLPYAAWTYRHPEGTFADLADHLTLRWDLMDAWYEEAEEVFIHARDPHKRVDVLRSDRQVEISLGELRLAVSDQPFVLFETHLPTRYYLPLGDVAFDLLEESDTVSGCPYKGIARYWSVAGAGNVGRDVAWSYPNPIAEQPKLAGLIAFYNERLDIVVDGEIQERPITPWS